MGLEECHDVVNRSELPDDEGDGGGGVRESDATSTCPQRGHEEIVFTTRD